MRNEEAREVPNVWRQWRAQRVHCTPGLGWRLNDAGWAEEGYGR